MKILSLSSFIFAVCAVLTASSAYAAINVSANRIGSSDGISVYDLTVAVAGSQNRKKVYIVNDGISNPKKVVWLFHGFKPDGDPYNQSPREFIERWNLVQLCRKNGYMCIAPDMGASMYPLKEKDADKISDMRWLNEAYKELVFKKHKDLPVIVIGVSTGVEGAIKFSSIDQINIESVVAMSGTYDFFMLQENSGEYRIHQYVFGNSKNVWLAENPVEILKRLVRTKLYLFCESGSIYRKQAEMLRDQRFSNIDVVDKLALGNGYSHSWAFWGSAPVVKALHEILTSK